MNAKVISSAEVAVAANKNDSHQKNRDALRNAVNSFSALVVRVREHFEMHEAPKKWSDRFIAFVGDGTTLSLYRVNDAGKQTPTAEGQAFRRAFIAAFPPDEVKAEPASTITLALRALRRAAKSGERPSTEEAIELLALTQGLAESVQD